MVLVLGDFRSQLPELRLVACEQVQELESVDVVLRNGRFLSDLNIP